MTTRKTTAPPVTPPRLPVRLVRRTRGGAADALADQLEAGALTVSDYLTQLRALKTADAPEDAPVRHRAPAKRKATSRTAAKRETR